MTADAIEVGKAYVVSCPDRGGLRIGKALHVNGGCVTVQLRRGGTLGRGWASPRIVHIEQVRREATPREVAVAMPIH